ncbi:class F sortase [Gryllotalpicola ginsengisoli]|uniref:class F sortase n=1 Tax=Gryllotalpicola ginsengisoli TaxID=444608 RepID=UPI0006842FC2|nr:class F sortase [Gryllotalpicola ginsengisoli]
MRRSRSETLITTAALLVALALVVTGVAGVIRTQHDHTLKDLAGNTVTFDPGTIPAPEQQHKMSPTPAQPGDRLIVSAVGLDVPLGSLSAVDNEIEPPTFTSAYWIRNLGTTPSTPAAGTVFIAMHSLRNGGIGPGNYLYDTATGHARVKPGQTATVNGINYTITGTTTIAKPLISADTGIWANTPNRLVMITCLELPNGAPSQDNFIVTATRTTGR